MFVVVSEIDTCSGSKAHKEPNGAFIGIEKGIPHQKENSLETDCKAILVGEREIIRWEPTITLFLEDSIKMFHSFGVESLRTRSQVVWRVNKPRRSHSTQC